jgi:uncharacterized membrane protein
VFADTVNMPLVSLTVRLWFVSLLWRFVMDYITRDGSRIRLTSERDFSVLTFCVVMVVSIVTALVAILELVSLCIGD